MAGWNRVHGSAPVDVAVEGTLVQVARPGTGCLSHVLVSDGEAAVFDPSSYHEEYESILDAHGADLVGVFDSHAHADHLSGGRELAARHDVPYHLHPADAADPASNTPLADGDEVTVGSVTVDVLHTPGHTPGGVSFGIEGEAVLTGDAQAVALRVGPRRGALPGGGEPERGARRGRRSRGGLLLTLRAKTAALVALLAGGCVFDGGDFSGTSFRCDESEPCPPGFDCEEGRCVRDIDRFCQSTERYRCGHVVDFVLGKPIEEAGIRCDRIYDVHTCAVDREFQGNFLAHVPHGGLRGHVG
jgi:glyoxylase-like metal-dependent hydrolase (beta-lactamase superfamily II)